MLHDRVTVDEERLHQRTGFWFAPRNKGFSLNELRAIEIWDRVDRRGATQRVWTGVYADGHSETVNPGDLWDSHEEELVAWLRARHIVVEQH